MDIRAMRYFVAIVDHGSLTRAAEVVCVAQPALSQQLAAPHDGSLAHSAPFEQPESQPVKLAAGVTSPRLSAVPIA